VSVRGVYVQVLDNFLEIPATLLLIARKDFDRYNAVLCEYSVIAQAAGGNYTIQTIEDLPDPDIDTYLQGYQVDPLVGPDQVATGEMSKRRSKQRVGASVL
jgi:hypothetical protein